MGGCCVVLCLSIHVRGSMSVQSSMCRYTVVCSDLLFDHQLLLRKHRYWGLPSTGVAVIGYSQLFQQ